MSKKQMPILGHDQLKITGHNVLFFLGFIGTLLAKMVPVKQTKRGEGTRADISSPIRMRD